MSAVYPNWSSSTTYSAGQSVSYIGLIYRALQTTRGNAPTTLAPNWAVNSPTPGGGVSAVSAGNAITITGTASNPVVNNNGVVALTQGTNITLTPTVPAPASGVAYTISASGGSSGVQSVSASGGCASSGGVNPNITNTGVLSVSTSGSGISSSGGQNPVLSTSAVLGVSTLAGTALVSSGGQNPVISYAPANFYTTLKSSDNPTDPTGWAGLSIANALFIQQPSFLCYNITDDAGVGGVNLQLTFAYPPFSTAGSWSSPTSGVPNYISNISGANLYLYCFIFGTGDTGQYIGASYQVSPGQTALITPVNYYSGSGNQSAQIGLCCSLIGSTVLRAT